MDRDCERGIYLVHRAPESVATSADFEDLCSPAQRQRIYVLDLYRLADRNLSILHDRVLSRSRSVFAA